MSVAAGQITSSKPGLLVAKTDVPPRRPGREHGNGISMAPARRNCPELHTSLDSQLPGYPVLGEGLAPDFRMGRRYRAKSYREYYLPVKRPIPVTSCTACGNAGYNLTLADGRCGKTIGGERCKGTNSSAANDGDWQECWSCRAIGVERNAPCTHCRGTGWRFARMLG
jgi:hypothetical protein